MDNYIELLLDFEPNSEEYLKVVERLRGNPQSIRLLHSTIGIATEAGELLDQIKKHLFYGRELDTTNVVEELGDLFWYQGVALNALAILLERDPRELENSIKERNIAKLDARYKAKAFNAENAINRDTDVEREILQNG